MQQITSTTHHTIAETKEVTAVTNELRDNFANFEDFLRPIRSYFYWEKHCHTIPICWSLKSVFESVDGVDKLRGKMRGLIKDLDQMDAIMPQLVAQFPPMIATINGYADHDAVYAQHHVGGLRPNGRDDPRRQCHGPGVRRRQKRRFFLFA